ncbi:adhesion G protein-coupled receptor E1 [Callospermophilus lateralis]|uniref:adhesion G protein-coupled receptor E1 n=1 Tax=Callospermophilus lateralis TaxID=76772 RepID=UPI004053EBB4
MSYVNECADTTTCPAYATCTNTVGSYYCTCKQGFLSSNGQNQFRGPGVECEDVDECTESPPRCGPHSVCKNMLGRYRCSCLPGFSSPTGDWVPGRPGTFSCRDIDECLTSGICPEHSTCVNSVGSYHCSCQVGFFSNGSTCEDVDECSESPPRCGPHSVCKNMLGRYRCSCLPGFSSPTGDWVPGRPGTFSCRDIDECLTSGICPEHSTCVNSVGSYHCSCQAGFFSNGSTCEDVNECADTTTCPAYATCTNTVGSYYCTCKQGFLSSNGQNQFRGPGVECEDVDECTESPPRCGPHSVCKNVLGRYRCSCLPGFSSPTGDWVPGRPGTFSCRDVDECSESPPRCGPHSVCKNMLGRYRCSCLPGFSSPTGDWVPGRPGTFSCRDVNECADTTTCPAYATCTNTVGSYYCTCKQGFLSSNGQNQFRGPGVECEDVDECTESPPRCGPHSVCKNVLGRYRCSCLPGFSSPTGDWVPGRPGTFSCRDIDECLTSGICPEHSTCVNSVGSYHCSCQAGFFSNGSTCEDVDECSRDPPPCGPNAVCTNTPGSYGCRCTAGFRPHHEGSQTHGDFSCKRILFKCKEDLIPHNKQAQQCQAGAPVELEYLPFCALMNDTFRVLDKTCENKSAASLQSAAESFTSVLEQKSKWTKLSREETSALATVLLESVQSSTLAALLKPSENVSQTVQTEHLDIESKVIKEDCLEENGFYLKAKGDGMKISCSMIKESRSSGSTGVAFVSFANMESVLDERFFQGPQSPRANFKQRLRMNSRIVGGIITGEKKDNLSEPVIYVLENLQPKQKFERPICVSWSSDVGDGGWTPAGCEVLKVLETHTVCSCNRLANLAILMALEELRVAVSLEIISLVGLSLSLVCLVLAIATFLLCRAIRSRNTSLHLHLCVCLFLAKILFLTGVDKTDNQTGCAIIAGCLHYLFLACFSWTLVEAVTLFLMVRNLKVVNYFSSHNISMLYLCAFGYGFPGLVVAISASLYLQGYGTHNRCWLSTARGFIWSFLGPVSVIILINFVLLTWTLCILRRKLSSVNAEVSKLRDTRLLTFKAFAQFFILGCPWVLGFFQIGQMASIMAYLFTIINSLQGTFIFIIHCLLSRQVREEYRRWLTRKTKPSSQSQTSGILLSSMPSSSKMTEGGGLPSPVTITTVTPTITTVTPTITTVTPTITIITTITTNTTIVMTITFITITTTTTTTTTTIMSHLPST